MIKLYGNEMQFSSFKAVQPLIFNDVNLPFLQLRISNAVHPPASNDVNLSPSQSNVRNAVQPLTFNFVNSVLKQYSSVSVEQPLTSSEVQAVSWKPRCFSDLKNSIPRRSVRDSELLWPLPISSSVTLAIVSMSCRVIFPTSEIMSSCSRKSANTGSKSEVKSASADAPVWVTVICTVCAPQAMST